MSHLKSLINEAIKQGYLSPEDYPFRNYHVKTGPTRHSYLLPEELAALEKLTIPSQWNHLSHTLDAFLFCCYTGLRYSDFKQLTPKNFIFLNGDHWLIFRSIKTKEEIKLPLNLLFHA